MFTVSAAKCNIMCKEYLYLLKLCSAIVHDETFVSKPEKTSLNRQSKMEFNYILRFISTAKD